jgi:Resolvase, N terminal domain
MSTKPTQRPKAIRCAIYTRKSTEEGLDQQYNSLDSQCDAGEAYIRSQTNEGWELVPDRYDDGGFSGGNIERPALKRMMEDIRFDEMLRTGEASDTIELARRGHVTQPRMSQIMALNQLAPDIQEALLNLPATKGKPEIHEKRLRPIAAMLHWEDQREAWGKLSCFASTGAEHK